MKLSEMQNIKNWFLTHKRSEISNEELQKTFITDGAILSNLYQEMEMDSDSVDCHDDDELYERQHPASQSYVL